MLIGRRMESVSTMNGKLNLDIVSMANPYTHTHHQGITIRQSALKFKSSSRADAGRLSVSVLSAVRH